MNFGNRGNDINPDDVASVTVLAGPAATALYGSRASNGALIITTKSGNISKKAEITFSTTNTFSSVLKLPDFQNQYGQGFYTGVNSDGTLSYDTQDWGDNWSWGAPFTGKVEPWGQQIDGVQQQKPYSATPNNIKHFFSTGFVTNNNIGITSGNDKSSYYLGLNSENSNGIYPTSVDDYNKYSVRFNGKANLSNNFYTSVNFNYVRIQSNNVAGGQAGGSVLQSLYQTPRDIPIDKMGNLNNKYNGYGYTDAGGVYHPDKFGFYNEFYPSPWLLLRDYKNYDDVDRVTGGINLGYKPVPWLDVLERVTTDFSSDRRRLLTPKFSYTPADPGVIGDPAYPAGIEVVSNGGYEEDTYTTGEINHDLMVTAKKNLNDDFSGSLMVGNNVRLNNSTVTVTSTNQSAGLITPGWYNFGNSNGPIYATNYHSTQRRVSVYGDLNLAYRNMVYLDATARNDWSSTLPVDANSFFYPSVSGSFIFSELLKGSTIEKILNYGKLRASWAQVGNDAGPYQLTTGYSQASIADGYTNGNTIFPFSGVPGLMINSTLGDARIKPEITTSREIGTELGFLDNRLSVIANYYSNRSKNQIVASSVAPSSGYLFSIVNAGVIQNQGVELTLRGTPIKTADFSLELFATYTRNKNKVLSLPNHAQIQVGGFNGMAIVAQEGKPYGEFYAVSNQTENGHTVVGASDGEPLPTANAVYLGSYNPKYQGSFGGTLNFKNTWMLSFLFDTKQGGVYYSNTKSGIDFNGTSAETGGNRNPQIWANSVINTGTASQPVYQTNTTAKFIPQDYYANFEPAGMDVVDASYVKLRSLQLEYQLPARLLNNSPFGHASVGLFGNNLFLWTPKSNKYVDPEMNSSGSGNEQGFDFTAQPSVRNYGFNIKVTF